MAVSGIATRDVKMLPARKQKKIFWREKFKANVERDRKIQKELKSMGWSIQIIWECELSDPEEVKKSLKSQLN